MAEQDFITGPFGSSVGIERPVAPEAGPSAGTGTPLQDGPRVSLTDATVAGDQGFAESRGARDARAAEADSTILEGVGAAITTWDTTRLIKRIGRPEFENDTKINQFEYLENTPMALDEDEHEFFMDVGKGEKSAKYAIEQIEARRMAHKVAGAHPAMGMATQFIDPVWLAIPPALRVGKAAPMAGRTISAGVSGAGSAGVVAAGEGPVSDDEIALSWVVGTGAGAVFYKPGKGLVNADADFPKDVVDTVVADLVQGAEQATAKPRMRMTQQEEWEEVEIPVAADGIAGIKRTELGDVMLTPSSKEAGKYQMTFWEGAAGTSRTVSDSVFDTAEEAVKAFDETVGEVIKRTWTGDGVPTVRESRKVKEAVWEEVPAELAPNAVRSDPIAVVAAVDTAIKQQTKAAKLGEKIMWNMHKSMTNFGPAGRRIANVLYDNNSDLTRTSVESQREAILSDLRRTQFEYEDIMRKSMADQGYGTLKMMNPFTSRQAYAVQAEIERQVFREMLRREQMSRSVSQVRDDVAPPHITAMADKLDELHKRALAEMKRAGVEGADAIKEQAGYITRKWNSTMIDDVIERFKKQGLDEKAAHSKVVDLVAVSLARGSRMDATTSRQIGGAIVDRALRKGYFEDSLFNPAAGEGQMKELRDILAESGMAPKDVERAVSVLRNASDEQGKAGFMKHRVDLDYNASVRVGKETVSIVDLLDSRVTSIVDQYTQRVSTNAAFARSGMPKRSDVEAMREELMRDTPVHLRDKAKDLFDDTIAYYRGEPSGGKMHDNMRLMQTYGRSIALAWSGLWQLTEFATAMGEYGMKKSLKYAVQEFPGFKQIMNLDKKSATSLENVLSNHSVQSLRLRPYLARYADGYEMNTGSALQLASQPIGQAVPMANAMEYVHANQARIVGNLILDRVQLAAKGDPKAREALAKYGLEAPVMDKLAAEIAAKGLDVDKWDDAVWAATRPAFAKMMDASVLKGRLGDTPAFTAFDPVGKFIFMYRSFVLTAHNKIVAGTMARDGSGALGLILLYQFPLALAAVQARATVMGEGQLSTDDLVKQAVGQMGGLGLFSEPFKWATGESNAWGASGLIPVDRGIRMFQSAANADAEKGASTALTMLPVISAVPFMRGMSEQIKE